jgi:riboflavin kinase / FMN adenylyltransferase
MQIVTDSQTLSASARGGGWLIGNFDGVHKGHQTIIARQREAWGAVGVITFEPHPRQFFLPHEPFLRLTDAATKVQRLEAYGVSRVLQLSFNAQLAALGPADFVNTVLQGQCGAQKIAVGEGFRFGAQRAGDVGLLQALLGKENVTVLPVVRDESGQPYSSSRIRAALASGDKSLAGRLLGW